VARPAHREEHGLSTDEVSISDETLLVLTRGYARDAGVGNLRRSLAAIMRYLAHEKAQNPAGTTGRSRAS
jgi:ATP-dependent Lon protease